MDKFSVLNGLVAPLDRANVDTDQIIPKEYLSSIKRTGFAAGLFGAWRKDPEFVLNQARYKGRTHLVSPAMAAAAAVAGHFVDIREWH